MSTLSGQQFRLLKAENRRFLETLIKIARTCSKPSTNLYPAWQGMQYVHEVSLNRSIMIGMTVYNGPLPKKY